MAYTSYAATEEMTNINRVSRLLMDPCTDQMRDLLRSFVPPASLSAAIRPVILPRLTEPQRKLILPNSGVYSGNYNDMDISLLYILLRNVCRIQAHNKGWGNTPDYADRSMSANIERLRLTRNHCGHFTGGMSNAEFNQIWSEIRAAVVDLDKSLGNRNKYQQIVDFIRHDTMDPVMEKHYRDQLLEQIKEKENIMKEVDSLKRKTKENDEQVQQRIQNLESSQQSISNRNIPLNIKDQHNKLLESWLKDDKPFHEIHSFPNILDKVQSQPITTIIGGPGSGKTATARHLALRLQTDCEFEIVPLLSVSEVIQYGYPKCKQLFILDDVIGVFGVEYEKITNLITYKERIFNVLGKFSKILFTCRKAVYNESLYLNSFILNEKYLIDLQDSNNRLNTEDMNQILNNHCKQNAISLRPDQDELPHVSSTIGCMMFPLLCKLFCSESKYQALGNAFFEKPYVCIAEEMDYLRGYKKIQYASLVLCMFCQNKITESMMKTEDSRLMEIKQRVFQNCRVNGWNSEIIDALDNMINTFTICTNKSYSLIHDSVCEVLAFHYGNKHQEDLLEYMSSSFVAKKFSINDTSDDPGDLHIKIKKEYYPAFAGRLVRDLKSLELHDVFMNKTLRIKYICSAFIDQLKELPYIEIKKLFFEKQKNAVDIFVRGDKESFNRENHRTFAVERGRQTLLVGDMLQNVRVISWVVSYGHSQLLQFLFDHVTKHMESIRRVMDWEVPGGSGNSCISDRKEQTRLLILSCYSGDVKVVKLLLKHCDVGCINDSYSSCINPFLLNIGFVCMTPLYAALLAGHGDIVNLLIKSGADCNKSDGNGKTPLTKASSVGHGDIVELLIKSGADCNKNGDNDTTPLYAASFAGHGDIVGLLIKGGADCNKSDRYGRTPLSIASYIGHGDIVELLIKKGADCNKNGENGTTPLYEASYVGHSDIVDLLIKGGADCNKSNSFGRTPLCAATNAGHVEIIDLLIKGGADCNKSDRYGRTPLSEASYIGHGDIVELLIKSGADCNKNGENGTTPLHEASYVGHSDIVNLLIKSRADCNKSDVNGRSPLYEASNIGHYNIVDLLIKGGADCNKSDVKGRTPLCAASEAGYGDIVEVLIKGGADCNKSDSFGRTPLYIASQADNVQQEHWGRCLSFGGLMSDYEYIVRALIESGADINLADLNGESPLSVALKHNRQTIAEILLKHGAKLYKSEK